MNAYRFVGASSREVLGKVRTALGEDALILSNRPVEGGLEVLALPGTAFALGENPPSGESPSAESPAPAVHAAAPDGQSAIQDVLDEIQSVRKLLQHELGALACGELQRRDPQRAAALRELLNVGFSPVLARRLAEVLPQGGGIEQALRGARAQIERDLPLAEADGLIVVGGIYALMGPTGVGKTTTIAKLAARGVVRHGAGRVALLTTDGYRVAAHDQLRVYAKILGVPMHMIKDAADLAATLAELKNRHLVLIDTAGMSQRDEMLAEQSAVLGASGQVKRLLLLNATCGGATLDEVVGAYQQGGVDGCVITKLDEAAGLATVIDAVIRHRLPLHYVTNGQRVPEDLHLPHGGYLAQRALKPVSANAARELAADELPLALAGAGLA